MRAILRSWWDVTKTLGRLFRLTLRYFWHEPARMLHAAWLNTVVGDKDAAQKQIEIIESRLAEKEKP